MPRGIYKRTEKIKKAISEAKMGSIPWNKGKKGVVVGWNKGKKLPYIPHPKQRGFIPWNKGRKMSDEIKKKISDANKGRIPWNKGGTTYSKNPEETRRKRSIASGGTGIVYWGTKRYHHIKDIRYKRWRMNIFTRDNFTCQFCGFRGGYVEAHHLKSWAKYTHLRYDVTNGVTLCRECHKLTRK